VRKHARVGQRTPRRHSQPDAFKRHATAASTRPKSLQSTLQWLLISAFCVAVVLCVVAIASATQSNNLSPADKKQQSLLHDNQQLTAASPKPTGTNQMPTAQPVPTRQAGIVAMHQGPFLSSIFRVQNFYQGPVGSDWVLVYAGSKTNPDGSSGQGGVVLYTETINQQGGFDRHPLGTFLAPNSTALTSTAANGNLLTLRSTSGQVLTFDLSTHQYGLPV